MALLIVAVCILAACMNDNEEEFSPHNPTPDEVLSEDGDADIFLEGDLVYTNAEDIDWVEEEDLTIGEEVGEIGKQTDDSEEFEDLAASKLPVGTKIYELAESEGKGIYIVKVDDEEIRYLGLIEG